MRKTLPCCLLMLLCAVPVLAVEPELVWGLGGVRLSTEARTGFVAEGLVSIGDFGGLNIFAEPLINVKKEKFGCDLGMGVRTEVLSGEAIAGGNLFFDYTDENDHKRFGLGGELLHRNFSLHGNVYIPVTDERGGEEALPGFDLYAGVPLPQAPFFSVWPGVYYYNGNDEDDLSGVSLALKAQPTSAVSVSLGFRGDALDAGKDDRELFLQVDMQVPMRRLGKELFAFDRGTYPRELGDLMGARIERERFITFERKPGH